MSDSEHHDSDTTTPADESGSDAPDTPPDPGRVETREGLLPDPGMVIPLSEPNEDHTNG